MGAAAVPRELVGACHRGCSPCWVSLASHAKAAQGHGVDVVPVELGAMRRVQPVLAAQVTKLELVLDMLAWSVLPCSLELVCRSPWPAPERGASNTG